MFQLLVKYNGWANGRDFLPLERVFEYTDAELIPRGTDGSVDFDRLIGLGLPALFATEIKGSGPALGRVGMITHARVTGNRVEINYTLDAVVPPIPTSRIERLTPELLIDSLELSRTHWAIKNVDLFRVLLTGKILSAPEPVVFKLDDGEVDAFSISAMMPFDPRFDDVYASIQEAARKCGMTCLRADDIWEDDKIIQDVVSLIRRSRVVVADCTGRNANVFYEVGIAHTLGRPVILMSQLEADIPFDLRQFRYIHYLNNGEGRAKLVGQLEKRIGTLLGH